MNLRREVSKELMKRGFRRDGRTHLRRVDEEFSVGVDTGPLEKRADIAPFVGIRHDGVETLLAELADIPADDWVFSVGANVGYVLGGEYLAWEPPSQVREVVEVIDSALGHLHSFLSLECLPKAWSIKGAKDPMWRYREMILLLLRGEKLAIGEKFLDARRELCKREDEICEQYRGFERRLQERL